MAAPNWILPYPQVNTLHALTAEINVETDVVSTVYWVALPHGAPAPTSLQVSLGQDSTGSPVATAGNEEILATWVFDVTVNKLVPATQYDIYFVADTVPGGNLQPSPVSLTITTLAAVYVDLGIAGAGGAGTSADPIGLTAFLAGTGTGTVLIKGVGSAPASNWVVHNNVAYHEWDAYLPNSGSIPWHLQCNNITCTTTNTNITVFIYGGVINIAGSITLTDNVNIHPSTNSVSLNCTTTSLTVAGSIHLNPSWSGGPPPGNFTAIGSLFLYGSDLRLGGTIGDVTGPSSTGMATFRDSVFVAATSNPVIFTPSGPYVCSIVNSVTNLGTTVSWAYGDSQINWSPVSLPAWNDTVADDWESTVLGVGITTPPEPGTGQTPTGLFGEPRLGIGAFYFSIGFHGTPTAGLIPLSVQFTDDSVNGPETWSWTFGDGGVSTAQNPLHNYVPLGVYDVTLTTTKTGHPDKTLTKTAYITAAQYTWTQIQSSAAFPARQDHGCINFNGYFWVIGGQVGNYNTFDDIWQ